MYFYEVLKYLMNTACGSKVSCNKESFHLEKEFIDGKAVIMQHYVNGIQPVLYTAYQGHLTRDDWEILK